MLYGEVVVPSAVVREIRAGGHGSPAFSEVRAASWIREESLAKPIHAELLADLDLGEAEVLALAIENTPSLALLDERLARAHARRLGISISGTLGVLLEAKRRGYIGEVGPSIRLMVRGGIWVSDSLIKRAMSLAGEDL